MSDDERAAAELPPGASVLWPRARGGTRPGRRPGLTLAGIAAAGVAVADEDGLDGVSMAKVAERLGVTTMALYRYVAGKDELLALMFDTALRAPEPAPDADGPWRPRLEAWCRAHLALVGEHPWVVALTSTTPPMGPQRVAWIERGLEALAGTPLPVPMRVAVIGMLSLQVLTWGQVVAAYEARRRGRDVEAHPALLDYGTLLRAVVDPATSPYVAEALEAGAFDDDATADPDEEWELALGLLLDGVSALVARFEDGPVDDAPDDPGRA